MDRQELEHSFTTEFTAEDAFWALADKLTVSVQSPEARDLEMTYRLEHLEELLADGDWIQDSAGNVVPSSLCDYEQAAITRHAVYSIIDGLPSVKGEGQLVWQGRGILISNVTVFFKSPGQSVNLKLGAGSTIIGSAFHY